MRQTARDRTTARTASVPDGFYLQSPLITSLFEANAAAPGSESMKERWLRYKSR